MYSTDLFKIPALKIIKHNSAYIHLFSDYKPASSPIL